MSAPTRIMKTTGASNEGKTVSQVAIRSSRLQVHFKEFLNLTGWLPSWSRHRRDEKNPSSREMARKRKLSVHLWCMYFGSLMSQKNSPFPLLQRLEKCGRLSMYVCWKREKECFLLWAQKKRMPLLLLHPREKGGRHSFPLCLSWKSSGCSENPLLPLEDFWGDYQSR